MAESAYRVREGFSVFDANGMPRVLRKGDFIPAGDPVVKTHRGQLEPLSAVIEQTTAAPGERRPVDFPSGVTNERATKARDTRVGTRKPKEQDMPARTPRDPSSEDSAASEFAPFQPGAGVVADDVQDKGAGQTAEEFTPPEDVDHSKDENQPTAAELAEEGKTEDEKPKPARKPASKK